LDSVNKEDKTVKAVLFVIYLQESTIWFGNLEISSPITDKNEILTPKLL
jgi:hypothetical protein